jgi:voltage-gated potassium channel
VTTLHPLPRGRAVVVLVRALTCAVLIVVIFYVTPLRMTVDVGTLVRLILGLAVLSALIAWQLRGIARSPYPTLRAFETLAVAIPLFLLLFAATYTILSQVQPAAFTEPMSRTDAVYFTVTIFATVGFGDISPVSTAARALVTVQMIADLLLLGLVLRAVINAVDRGHGRLSQAPPD